MHWSICRSRLPGRSSASASGERRGDHPDLLMPYIEALVSLCRNEAERREVGAIARELEHVRVHLDGRLYERLPKTVIHGDMHPGNCRFSGGRSSSRASSRASNGWMMKRQRCRGVSAG